MSNGSQAHGLLGVGPLTTLPKHNLFFETSHIFINWEHLLFKTS
jgi:hypothetical protein